MSKRQNVAVQKRECALTQWVKLIEGSERVVQKMPSITVCMSACQRYKSEPHDEHESI